MTISLKFFFEEMFKTKYKAEKDFDRNKKLYRNLLKFWVKYFIDPDESR